MIIRSLELKNIRCFEEKKIDLHSNFVVMQGNNGVGKTSILESLHYACYLRSFRTRTVRDLIQEHKDYCYIAVDFYQPRYSLEEKITVGVGRDSKKIIKLNEEPVQAFKTLMDHYRVVTLTADDLSLVSGEPDERRSFMNAAISLQHSDQINLFREYSRVLALRNAYLAGPGQRSRVPSEEFYVWTKLFWQCSSEIQVLRKNYLADVQTTLRKILQEYLSDISYEVSLEYLVKKLCDTKFESFDEFWNFYVQNLFEKEQYWQRSLFGIHLDDFSILLDGRKARLFASRGQQKLLAYLIKIVQVLESIKADNPAVFLVDDFLTDFDKNRAQACLSIIQSLATQVILTIPLEYERLFSPQQAQIIQL